MKRIFATALVASLCAALGVVGMSAAAPHKTNKLPLGGKVAGRFAILRSARTASSDEAGLPATTASSLTAPGAFDAELELEPSRAVDVRLPGEQHGWVVPGKRGICLVVASSIEITKDCALSASAAQRGIVMISRDSKSTTAYGLVPDDASVSAIGESGEAAPVPVEDNVFAYQAASLRAVSVHSAGSGVSTTPVG
jgi:hypothetical protein